MDIRSVIIEKIEKISGKLNDQDRANLDEIEIKKIGLDSMTLISFLLELETEGYIDISEIEYEQAPEKVGEIIDLINQQNKMN